MRQRELEIRLERVPRPPRPEPGLEQYRTPTPIAADLLYRALGRGDIEGRRVVDLGCGTGMFSVGAALLGAASVTGIDIDEASLALARTTAADLGLNVGFAQGDVSGVTGSFDTALTNPPFGAQFAQRHADSLFLQAALRVAPVCYSLHLDETRPHLERLARALGTHAERLTGYRFPLPRLFSFHTKDKLVVDVGLYRYERVGRA